MSLALLAAAPVIAQGAFPDTLVWEQVDAGWPDQTQASTLSFDADTLYASTNSGVWRLDPGGAWRLVFGRAYSTDEVSVEGPVVLMLQSGLQHSANAGATFREVLDHPEAFPVRLPSGRLIVADEDPRGVIATSDDDGARWDRWDYLAPYWLGSFAALTPRGPGADPAIPPAGRVVGFGISGMATSDDGGETWAPTDLTCQLCLRVAAVVTLDGGPEGGRAVASVDDNR